jgi:hypothetical protein
MAVGRSHPRRGRYRALKAALLYGIGDLRLVDIPKPEYGPDEVLT